MIEFIVGLVLGELLGARWGWPRDAVWILDGLLAGGTYLLSCVVYPHRRCPACKGRSDRRYDGRGNYRHGWACWLCGGAEYVRFGARLLGRG